MQLSSFPMHSYIIHIYIYYTYNRPDPFTYIYIYSCIERAFPNYGYADVRKNFFQIFGKSPVYC